MFINYVRCEVLVPAQLGSARDVHKWTIILKRMKSCSPVNRLSITSNSSVARQSLFKLTGFTNFTANFSFTKIAFQLLLMIEVDASFNYLIKQIGKQIFSWNLRMLLNRKNQSWEKDRESLIREILCFLSCSCMPFGLFSPSLLCSKPLKCFLC